MVDFLGEKPAGDSDSDHDGEEGHECGESEVDSEVSFLQFLNSIALHLVTRCPVHLLRQKMKK